MNNSLKIKQAVREKDKNLFDSPKGEELFLSACPASLGRRVEEGCVAFSDELFSSLEFLLPFVSRQKEDKYFFGHHEEE